MAESEPESAGPGRLVQRRQQAETTPQEQMLKRRRLPEEWKQRLQDLLAARLPPEGCRCEGPAVGCAEQKTRMQLALAQQLPQLRLAAATDCAVQKETVRRCHVPVAAATMTKKMARSAETQRTRQLTLHPTCPPLLLMQ